MLSRFWSLCFVLSIAALVSATVSRAAEPDPRFERFGLYVVASDLERAGAFYEKLFEKKPDVKTDTLIGFIVADGLYAVISESAYASGLKRGENVAPYLRVKDINAEFARVKAIAPASIQGTGIVTEGPFSFFKFTDPDSNVIEFFHLASAAPAEPKLGVNSYKLSDKPEAERECTVYRGTVVTMNDGTKMCSMDGPMEEPNAPPAESPAPAQAPSPAPEPAPAESPAQDRESPN